jgi:hypothetical protein
MEIDSVNSVCRSTIGYMPLKPSIFFGNGHDLFAGEAFNFFDSADHK